MKKIAALLIGTAWLCVLPCLSAEEYVETFDNAKDPKAMFGGFLMVGEDGCWKGRIENDSYVLSNGTDENAVRYYYMMKFPGQGDAAKDMSNATISVDVGGQFPTASSGAGLVFRIDPQNKRYYAFLIKQDGSYSFVKRDEEGFKEVLSGTSGDARGKKANQLMLKGNGEMVDIFLNGAQIGGFGNKNLMTGGVGIIGAGKGEFVFDNFRIVLP